MSAEVGYFQGSGGVIWRMALPLPEVYADQVRKHELKRVSGPDDPTPFVEPVEPVEEKPLTPKERIQADAAALGLSTDGTVAEITARIDAHVTDLLKQAGELGIDANELPAVELAKAIEAKLAE
ncbi:hypothetical protein Lesp02_70740 [Lentzea sp. NBRC 105346]|uniref:hypothetical protein n=1 Tax=Lentzea sp. NBRC 105346 TaxID=3032205 RepID=UPI0024A0EF83|nr:hypothetical protein [Lentzea sp. NBRC 105346]GLZ34887.1 hypothetical protein Lesp02_70740 [Lentzea sp. NBRC 105346]